MPGVCGNTTLSTNSGSFSDGSGSNNYMDDLDCSWLIEVDFGRNITLNFSSFNIEDSFDFVRVYDGNSINAPLLGEFSGTALPPAITPSNNQLLVRFTSDGFISSPGWEASYTSTPTTILFTSASNVNLPIEAGSSTITVTTNLSTASIILTDNVDWLMTSLVSQTLSLNYTANTTSSFRIGTITLTGAGVSQTVMVSQDFTPPPINLPFVDGFESIGAIKEFTTTTNSINGTSLWRYEKTNGGRLNFQRGAAFYRGGTHAATLDALGNGVLSQNDLILKLNLSNYSGSTNLMFSFWYMDHDDESHPTDRVWVRENANDSWHEIYDLDPDNRTDGEWNQVSMDLDAVLQSASVSLTASFEMRFGQFDGDRTISVTDDDGITFDDISVYEATQPITLTVSPSSQSFSASAGTTSFGINTNIPLSQIGVSDDADWLTTSLTTNTLIASFTESNLASVRTATITLSGESLTPRHVSIVQAAAAVSPILTVTPSLREVSNVSVSTQFTLMTNLLPHDISLSDDVDWLTTSLTGNTLRADYSTNTTTNARTATITIAGGGISHTVNIIQRGAACGNTTLSTNSGSFSDGSGSINYMNNVDCTWLIGLDFGRIITLNFSSFDTERSL